MIKAAVLGSPISHSLSPLLHKTAYELLGVDGDYSAIEMVSEKLATFIGSLDNSWRGLSLTMPLKESVLDLDMEFDEAVLRTRSANTILFNDEGRARATSTDYLAFSRLLKVSVGSRIAILGAGGTARSAIGSLDGRVPKIDIYLRDLTKGEILKDVAPNSEVILHQLTSLDAKGLQNYDWLVSTLPAGVADGLAQELQASNEKFPSLRILDVLYHPWPTELLLILKACGAQTLDGLDLLVEQALDQIALFTGEKFDYDTMRSVLIAKGLSALSQ